MKPSVEIDRIIPLLNMMAKENDNAKVAVLLDSARALCLDEVLDRKLWEKRLYKATLKNK